MIQKISIISLALFILTGISPALAATLTVVPSRTSADIGQLVRVDVMLDTQGESANAIQGTIAFPAQLFSLVRIMDGASPVSFWVEAPHEAGSGTVIFAGVMPGGFQGAASSVVSLVLNPLAGGAAKVSLADVLLLRNDGQGSAMPVAAVSANIAISKTIATSSARGGAGETVPSLIGPEPFTPVVASDPNVYGGKYFLAFSTTDKASGMDHYEVLEVPGAISSWQAAASPYLLQDQSLSSDIYVRAVDHTGNFIVVKLPAEHPGAVGKHAGSAATLVVILVLLGAASLGSLLWKRRRDQRRR